MHTIDYEVLRDVLYERGDMDYEEIEHAIYPDYSGRGMYGRKCLGLEFSELGEVISFAVLLAQADDGIALEWLADVRTDSLGLHSIAYWPAVTVENVPEREEA